MAGRTSKSQVVVLRSIRYGEADRILHLYSAEQGRIGAIAKGVRKTKSRFGARLEPLSHVELMLHDGAGELHTITGVELLRSHHTIREDAVPPERRPDRRRGDAAPLRRAGGERARVRGARRASSTCSTSAGRATDRPALDPLALVVPAEAPLALGLPAARDELRRVRRDRRARRLLGPRRRRRLRRSRAGRAAPLARRARRRSSGCSRRRSRTRVGAALSERARRDALAVVTSSYEEHGGFRLRTVSA